MGLPSTSSQRTTLASAARVPHSQQRAQLRQQWSGVRTPPCSRTAVTEDSRTKIVSLASHGPRARTARGGGSLAKARSGRLVAPSQHMSLPFSQASGNSRGSVVVTSTPADASFPVDGATGEDTRLATLIQRMKNKCVA
eukprot:scaffold1473_cov375-Prasinococcus_capsulatus_cf.AAC.1